MKKCLVMLIFFIFASCENKKVNLNPSIKFLNNETILWDGKQHSIQKTDSIIRAFRSDIPNDILDSVLVEFILMHSTHEQPIQKIREEFKSVGILRIDYNVEKYNAHKKQNQYF